MQINRTSASAIFAVTAEENCVLKSKRARGALLKITFPAIIIFWSIFNNGMRQITIISPVDYWLVDQLFWAWNTFIAAYKIVIHPLGSIFTIYHHQHHDFDGEQIVCRHLQRRAKTISLQDTPFHFIHSVHAAHMHCIYAKHENCSATTKSKNRLLRSHCWLLIAMEENLTAIQYTRVRHDKQ